jgi:hypothetical protein
MATRRQRVIYATISGITSLVLSTGFAVGYTTYQNHKWCETLNILTEQDPRTSPAASTALGESNRIRDIREYDALKHQVERFGCN